MTAAQPDHLVAAVMDVLDYDDPQQPWIVHGDRETLAERIVDALPLLEPVDPLPARVDCRPFTSDDAAAIAVLLVLAPVIGAVVTAAAWIRRRRHLQEYSS